MKITKIFNYLYIIELFINEYMPWTLVFTNSYCLNVNMFYGGV